MILRWSSKIDNRRSGRLRSRSCRRGLRQHASGAGYSGEFFTKQTFATRYDKAQLPPATAVFDVVCDEIKRLRLVI
jgi:hypothetical protein